MRELHFDVFKITGNFNSTSTFSAVDLSSEKYYDAILAGHHTAKCHSLFAFDPHADLPEGTETAVAFITKGCKLIQWPPPALPLWTLVKQTVLALHKLLTPLCRADEVIFERKYYFVEAGLRSEHIGMGTTKTWHGSANARVRGCELVVMNTEADDSDDDGVATDEEDKGSCSSSSSEADTLVSSDGASTNIEVKKKASSSRKHVSQLIATCVVSSFTEHQRHPSKNTLVPALLIDISKLRVCLYDCVNDVLFMSQPRLLSHKGIRLSTTAVVFLWLVIAGEDCVSLL